MKARGKCCQLTQPEHSMNPSRWRRQAGEKHRASDFTSRQLCPISKKTSVFCSARPLREERGKSFTSRPCKVPSLPPTKGDERTALVNNAWFGTVHTGSHSLSLSMNCLSFLWFIVKNKHFLFKVLPELSPKVIASWLPPPPVELLWLSRRRSLKKKTKMKQFRLAYATPRLLRFLTKTFPA